MVSEIRLYVEGGGDYKDTKANLRNGFGQFFAELRECARAKGVRWNITVCGGRDSTFDDYMTALRQHADALNLLLVDSEGPVSDQSPWKHLATRDSWTKPGHVEDKHCHLMVQMMEAWFLADREKLREFYGQRFQEGALPGNDDVESIPKATVESALNNATRNTQKGVYHKTRHAPLILERIRLTQVQEKAPHCRQFVETVKAEIDGSQ